MKKAFNITSAIVGIASIVLALLGLVAVVITLIQVGFSTLLIPGLIIVLAQMATGVLLVWGIKKDNAIVLLVVTLIAFVLIILDLFVLGGMVSSTGIFIAGLLGSAALLTIFQVIGYLLMAALVLMIVLKVVEMVKSK